MKDISLRKAIVGMAVLFIIGFAAGWFAWYAVYPNLFHNTDPSSSTSTGSWSGSASTGNGTTASNSSASGSTANW
ncbi:MAG: hypothetical protein ACP5T2_01315 [Thermoprotei archaeon]